MSGGQTGVDRAALDAAIASGIPWGGWCPRGGWAEDLADPPGLLVPYPALRPTPSADPAERTTWNVRDSDATVIVSPSGQIQASPGTALTLQVAADLGRPALVVALDDERRVDVVVGLLSSFDSDITLNVAGARESEAPGIYRACRAFLTELWPPTR